MRAFTARWYKLQPFQLEVKEGKREKAVHVYERLASAPGGPRHETFAIRVAPNGRQLGTRGGRVSGLSHPPAA